jgi:hypothetical protein
MLKILVGRAFAAGSVLLALGCSGGVVDTTQPTQLLTVSPRGGAVSASTAAVIVLTFSRPMMAGMEQYVALHQGGISGPTRSMSCSWSDGRMTLTCQPDQPLNPATSYAIHMGGGMMDADDVPVDMDRHGMEMGGQWVMGGMMGGQTGMMGNGWKHANGSYGMVFGFTTQ